MSHSTELPPERLLKVSAKELEMKRFESSEIEAIFRACNAFWLHNGNPKKPHVVLTSGLCSNGYINCREVLKRSNLCQIMAQQLVYLLEHYRSWLDNFNNPIEWVVGSASASTGLAKDVANILGAKWYPLQKGPDKTQIWDGVIIEEGETVLHVEELMTTALTAKMVRQGIKAAHKHPINFLPFLPVIIHRPDRGEGDEVDGSKVIHLNHYDIWAMPQENCPLCAQGSERIVPKGENWNRLING
ncbi:MAG: hypothetical protein WC610_00590 [Patescibacteria group bacterium]